MPDNPVFNRIDRDIESGRYAGFGSGQQGGPQYGAPQYGQPQQAPQFGQPQQYGAPQQGYGQQGYGQEPSPEQLEQMYNQAPAGPQQTGRMTVDDVMMKGLLLFGIVVAFAAAGWLGSKEINGVGAGLLLLGIVGTLGLGLVIAFKKTISVPLIIAYAVVEGLFVGSISYVYNSLYDGVVGQAVLATLCVFAAMFAGWKMGFIKVTERSRRIFGMALLGYFLFAIVNLIFAMVTNTPFGIGGTGMLGVAISVFAVGLASYSLAVDFDSIDRGVKAGLPEKTSWLMAHGLIVSLVWLYLEILRLLARLQSND